MTCPDCGRPECRAAAIEVYKSVERMECMAATIAKLRAELRLAIALVTVAELQLRQNTAAVRAARVALEWFDKDAAVGTSDEAFAPLRAALHALDAAGADD